jgi:hypothetical protein
MEPVRGQDDRKRERHAMDACGSRPVERTPELGAFPTAGIRSGPGLPRGQIGVWTGLIIPAPIWREGRDSPSGLRSHGWRSEAFSPLARPRQRQVGKSPQPMGRNRTRIRNRAIKPMSLGSSPPTAIIAAHSASSPPWTGNQPRPVPVNR